MNFFNWLRKLLGRPINLVKLSSDELEKVYFAAGGSFGMAMSYGYMGRPVGHDKMLDRWAAAEKEWARRGMRTVSLDEFVGYGGYQMKIEGARSLRKQEDLPIFHADLYREHYCGANALPTTPNPVVLALQTGEVQCGEYEVPSTERLAANKK